MKLIKQKGNTCLITCLAMVLDIKVSTIVKIIGHDGQDKVSDCHGLDSLRGVHPQELLDVCKIYNRWLVQVEANPTIGQPGQWRLDVYDQGYERLLNMIQGFRCVCILRDRPHAVALDEKNNVYDPQGYIGKLTDYKIDCAWIMI